MRSTDSVRVARPRAPARGVAEFPGRGLNPSETGGWIGAPIWIRLLGAYTRRPKWIGRKFRVPISYPPQRLTGGRERREPGHEYLDPEYVTVNPTTG
jgi:hypothetical protein